MFVPVSKRILRRPAGQSTNTYWKIRAFKRLGGFVCQCCEEHRKPFLSIDHIEGSGNKHRKQFKGGHAAFYKWIATAPEDVSKLLQILCMNCNWGKRYGACPHTLDTKTEQTREMALVLNEEIKALENERNKLKADIERIESIKRAHIAPTDSIPEGYQYVRHVARLSWKDPISLTETAPTQG